MFQVGDKVQEKGKNRVLEVINKLDDMLVLKDLGIEELNIITFNENQVEPYTENEIKVEKTNKISRISGSGMESIIEHNVDGNELNFKISKNPLNLATALKILLHETELYNYKYERVSPFKLNRKYNSELEGHVFTLEFIDIRTYEKCAIELLKTNKGMQLEGNFKIFIPDFLELCVERNILQRMEDGYKVVKRLHESMVDCTYLKTRPTKRELQREGFVIPKKYEEQYDLFA